MDNNKDLNEAQKKIENKENLIKNFQHENEILKLKIENLDDKLKLILKDKDNIMENNNNSEKILRMDIYLLQLKNKFT